MNKKKKKINKQSAYQRHVEEITRKNKIKSIKGKFKNSNLNEQTEIRIRKRPATEWFFTRPYKSFSCLLRGTFGVDTVQVF